MKNELNQLLGKNLYYLRTEYGLSQSSLARLLGISPGTLRHIEQGVPSKRTTARLLRRACEIFCISADAILRKDLDSIKAKPI